VNWSAPPEIAGLHPTVDGWNRVFPWIKGRHSGRYEAVYLKAGRSVHVRLPANVALDANASLWAVKSALKPRLTRRKRPFLRNTRANSEFASAVPRDQQ
jgi:hypothetical protein